MTRPSWDGTGWLRFPYCRRDGPSAFRWTANTSSSPFDGFSGHERFLVGTGNLVYRFKTSENGTVRPYLIGGGGVYNFRRTGSSTVSGNFSTSGSTTKFGINGGGGFDFKAGNAAALFVEGRFHDVFTSGKDETFIPITVGVRFGGP